jgi:hypothetical protein
MSIRVIGFKKTHLIEYLLKLCFIYRYAASQMQRLRQGFQAQAPPDRTSTTPLWRETVSMSEMSETFLSFRII